ncbi:hypothetical protein T10_3252 [Trichinella papuae]|uniref:Uncharacterized protein n=1 Tax=Trichinella papuae TaxID=268474 RepID=A0A0V1M3K6_9BILA|nr:hypothetical protein T10_3252 [Trichinella papuae]
MSRSNGQFAIKNNLSQLNERFSFTVEQIGICIRHCIACKTLTSIQKFIPNQTFMRQTKCHLSSNAVHFRFWLMHN